MNLSDDAPPVAGPVHFLPLARARDARADSAAGQLLLRWRFTTGAVDLGHGVVVDGVLVTAGRDAGLLDGERYSEAFSATGWTAAQR